MALSRQTYSRLSGFIFLFNLILGTGALALPRAFQTAGWLLTGVLLFCVAVLSFIPATFIVEAMAICNALQHNSRRETGRAANDEEPLDISTPIKEADFEIIEKFELGILFQKFAGRIWSLLFYLIISMYIYGDLSVYAAAVSKSLRDVTCNNTENSHNESESCWSQDGLSRSAVYKIYLGLFACSLGPFFFCNVTKTRWLQYCTIVARWIAIILMSSIALARIIEFPELPRLFSHQSFTYLSVLGSKVRPNPPISNFSGLPAAFGVCVYAFMCHHSLPGVITPIRDKRRLFTSIMLPAYLIIYACCIILSGTAVAAFDNLHDLYTINFLPSGDPSQRPGWLLLLAEYFLALYPVYALSSSFPVMGTTLTNNLLALLLSIYPLGRRLSLVVRWGVPLFALLPPILIAMEVNDIGVLVGITGAFGGSFIMYVFPTVLVLYARRALSAKLRSQILDDESVAENTPKVVDNPYRSPFTHILWPILLVLWAVSCMLVVALNKFGVF